MPLIHNELRYATRLLRGYRLAFGETSPFGVERLGETLTPIVDLWSDLSWEALRGELGFAVFLRRAADAGNASMIQVANPVDSGIICVVERVRIRTSAATDVTVNVTSNVATLASGATRGTCRDTRLMSNGGGTSIALGSHGVGPLAAENAVDAIPDLNGDAVIDPSRRGICVLVPGRSIRVHTAAVNVTLAATLHWRERQVFPGELDR